MSLGIKRELFGDIVEKDKDFYLAVDRHIYEYLKDHLSIRAGHVKVNHKPVEQINYLCNNKDIISFKKHGRVVFVDCNKQTRSDNYVVEGYFYK